MAPCPICRQPARPRPDNTAFPFCSPRCKQVDLGGWLSEKYRVPDADAPDEGLGDGSERYPEEKA